MRKFLCAFSALLLISACSDEKTTNQDTSTLSTQEALEKGEEIVARPQFDVEFEDVVYQYDINNLPQGCDKGSDIVCAIDLQVKCTINPKLAECDAKKLPRFTFMEDESLQRPTQSSFQIVKLKPIDATTVEVYTKRMQRCLVWFVQRQYCLCPEQRQGRLGC